MPRASSTPQSQVSASRRTGTPAAIRNLGEAQWRLLVRLPADVMIAAIAVQDGGPRRTVPEGLAGLDAIAAGRGSDSDLVRAAVAAIYTEPEDDRDQAQTDQADQAQADQAQADPVQPARRQARVLDDCRSAVEILRAGADPADAAAYRHWVQQVAVRVFSASRSGGVLGLGAERPSPPEQAFLNELAAVLS